MKKLITMLFVVIFAAGCSMQNANNEKNIRLIENYIQAVENMDYDAMGTLLDDAYLGVGPSVGDSVNKEIAVANWKYNVENLYQSIDYKKSRNIAVVVTTGDNQGEWVSNWAELDITYQDNKGSVTIFANTLYQISSNKVVKSYTIYNEADALRQLGYFFINPNDI
jgi:hypothetical protein